MADQMVWPPCLPGDWKWKWPRLTQYMHLRVVCLRLEGNLVHKYGSNKKMRTTAAMVRAKARSSLLAWTATAFVRTNTISSISSGRRSALGPPRIWDICGINRSRDVTVARPTPLRLRRPCILASASTSYAHPTNDVCSFPRTPVVLPTKTRLVAAVSGALPAT